MMNKVINMFDPEKRLANAHLSLYSSSAVYHVDIREMLESAEEPFESLDEALPFLRPLRIACMSPDIYAYAACFPCSQMHSNTNLLSGMNQIISQIRDDPRELSVDMIEQLAEAAASPQLFLTYEDRDNNSYLGSFAVDLLSDDDRVVLGECELYKFASEDPKDIMHPMIIGQFFRANNLVDKFANKEKELS